jgi:hypothetical protein
MTTLKNKKYRNIVELNPKQNIFDNINQRVSGDHTGSTVFVPHICNNVDLFGAGFAAQVSERYPAVKANYHLLGKSFLKSNLGHCQIIKVYEQQKYKHKLYFANMIAQNGTPGMNNARPLNYLALVKSMVSLSNYIKNNTAFLQKTEKVEIHAPKFGSGLAGGNWNFVCDLIEDIWGDFDVYIYNYSKR